MAAVEQRTALLAAESPPAFRQVSLSPASFSLPPAPPRAPLARQFSESSLGSHRLSVSQTDASHGAGTAESAAQARRPLLPTSSRARFGADVPGRMSAGQASDEFGARPPRIRARKRTASSWQEDAHRRRRQLLTGRTVLELIIGRLMFISHDIRSLTVSLTTRSMGRLQHRAILPGLYYIHFYPRSTHNFSCAGRQLFTLPRPPHRRPPHLPLCVAHAHLFGLSFGVWVFIGAGPRGAAPRQLCPRLSLASSAGAIQHAPRPLQVGHRRCVDWRWQPVRLAPCTMGRVHRRRLGTPGAHARRTGSPPINPV
jgi:hypothetical protein